jgi:undecaprenyl diphosphate synthase
MARDGAQQASSAVSAASNAIQSLAISKGIDLSSLPNHIAVIMDGNGRWAERQGLDRLAGHQEGYRNLRRVVIDCSELGIRFLTVYAFSAENWRRPRAEVLGLLKLLERAARDELRMMLQNNVRVRVAGRLHELPPGLVKVLRNGIEATIGNTGINLTLAINYGGRAEIVDAVNSILEERLPAGRVTERDISERLYLPELPEPDLMIRTAGELRWSNFLLWQAAYSELFVTPDPWPDFGQNHLLEAVLAFQRRVRKFGGLSN